MIRLVCLKCKSEKRSHTEKSECHEIIPCEFLLKKCNCKHDKDNNRNNLLDYFKLET